MEFWGPPFRFELMWMAEIDFAKLVKKFFLFSKGSFFGKVSKLVKNW